MDVLKNSKIVFIAPSLKLGGLENSSCVLANYFIEQNYRVNILTIFNHPVFYTLHPAINVISPAFPKNKVPKLWYYLKVVFFLRREIKKITPDRIISYGDWSNILVLMAVKGLYVKTYISDRASPGLKFPLHIRLLRRLLYTGASGIIAQTNRAACQKQKMLGSMTNIRVIPNPVRSFKQYTDIEKGKIVLAVARHYPVKGLDRLIEAFAMVKSENWTLQIAGSAGPATLILNELVKKYQLDDKVIFLGGIKEIDKVYAQSSILVLPSRSEGFPNALIEGMAHGLACISFDINAGPSDIIEHGVNGLLVEDGNIESLACQIQLLIDNKTLREKLGTDAKKIKEKLSLKKTGKMVEDFIFEKND